MNYSDKIVYNNKEYYDLKKLENNIVKELNNLKLENLEKKIKRGITHFLNIFKKAYFIFGGAFYGVTIIYAACKGIEYPLKWVNVLVGLVLAYPLIRVVLAKVLNEYGIARMVKVGSKGKEKRLEKELKLVRERQKDIKQETIKNNDLYDLQEYRAINLDTRVNAEKMALMKRLVVLNKIKKINKDKARKQINLEENTYTRVRK